MNFRLPTPLPEKENKTLINNQLGNNKLAWFLSFNCMINSLISCAVQLHGELSSCYSSGLANVNSPLWSHSSPAPDVPWWKCPAYHGRQASFSTQPTSGIFPRMCASQLSRHSWTRKYKGGLMHCFVVSKEVTKWDQHRKSSGRSHMSPCFVWEAHALC